MRDDRTPDHVLAMQSVTKERVREIANNMSRHAVETTSKKRRLGIGLTYQKWCDNKAEKDIMSAFLNNQFHGVTEFVQMRPDKDAIAYELDIFWRQNKPRICMSHDCDALSYGPMRFCNRCRNKISFHAPMQPVSLAL